MEIESQNISFEKPEGFLVTGIGASAGGIQALKEFFRHVPESSGIAYVVILHLSPDHDSKLAEVLQATASIPVKQVRKKSKIKPDHIYVVPPNQHLTIEDGYVIPSMNIHVEDRRAPVDIFFRSLADSHGPRAVCVVLSGTGANGSMGLKRVKERGGVVYAQNPQEAEFNEMPRNAIATELVDEILPVAQIASHIVSYRDSVGSIDIADEPEKRSENQQKALREIFTQLRVHTGHDFSNYKRPTLMRRVERRINIRQVPDVQTYASYLKDNLNEANALLKDLLISVTNFFRDKKSFDFLEREIIPQIALEKNVQKEIRVWVAGCATGEEAYSIAMLLAEKGLGGINEPKVQIFATDIDNDAIALAREGLYTINDAADVSPQRLSQFFYKEGDQYRVSKQIREMVIFANHNFIKDPPFSRLNLLACRNVLIYLNSTAQHHVMETFHFALKPGGFMFLGSSESVDGSSDLFATVSREHHIYQAREVSTRSFPIPQSVPQFQFVKQEGARQQEADRKPFSKISYGELHLKLLEQFTPPSIIINENFDIVHLSENAGKFLEFAGGEPSQNLLKQIKTGLRLELRSALHQAVQNQQPVEVISLGWEKNGERTSITIRIKPVTNTGNPAKGFLLVIFDESEQQPGEQAIVLRADEPIAKQLEEELIYVRGQLKRSVEQHEYHEEELKASNEELQAMNEELRSAAEELETSKEELQSMNEELRTVNQELKVKIDEMTITSSNLQNLINSQDIATVFLDRTFNTKMFTPAALDIFNLIPADYGRPISDITHKLQYAGLGEDVKTVLARLTIVEREVVANDGRVFMMRILPYRTPEDRISGIVITFFDITKLKQAEKELKHSEHNLRWLIESAKDYAIFSLDPDRKVTRWNTGAELMMGYTEKEIVGQSGDIIFIPEDRANQAPEKETETAATQEYAVNERWHLRKDGSRFWGSGTVRPIRDEEGNFLGFVKIMRNLTEQLQAQQHIREVNDRLQLALTAGKLGSYEYDFTSGELHATPQHKANYGIDEVENYNFDQLKDFIVGDDRLKMERTLARAIKEHSIFDQEYRIKIKSGELRWLKSVGTIFYNDKGAPLKLSGITLDITEQKLFTDELSKQVEERTLALKRSNEDLGQFAHVASHDLKEPVRKIQTFGNRLKEEFSEALPEKAQTYLEKITTSTKRMNSMIDGVLGYSKFINLPQSFKPVNLNTVIKEIANDLDLLIEKKTATFKVGELPTLNASEVLIYQLFYNLILNSLKFSKADVPPVISVACNNKMQDGESLYEIVVRDNGIGIDPEFSESVFESFTRLNPVEEYEGTGLGLALCKKIVERHNGSIHVISNEGEGATFRLLLPSH